MLEVGGEEFGTGEGEKKGAALSCKVHWTRSDPKELRLMGKREGSQRNSRLQASAKSTAYMKTQRCRTHMERGGEKRWKFF